MTTTTKTILAIIIVAALAVAGTLIYKASHEPSEPTENVTSSQPEPTGKKMAFSQLVAQGGTYECSATRYTAEGEEQGTLGIEKGYVHGVFVSTSDGKEKTTFVMIRDGSAYTWSASDSSEKISTSSAFFDTIGDYNCKEWEIMGH